MGQISKEFEEIKRNRQTMKALGKGQNGARA
jgi:hypothetical protein